MTHPSRFLPSVEHPFDLRSRCFRESAGVCTFECQDHDGGRGCVKRC